MSAALSPSGTRAFKPFLDEIDGTLCLPASATAADILAQAAPHHLRFPLILDATATLEAQVISSPFAPASSRFGPYCDNIMGMNWRLRDGRVVRVGERVVKTTTGYDWFRFLLHTRGRYGQPLHYVLRLRPDCGATHVFLMNDLAGGARQAAPLLLQDSWMHWFDAVEVVWQDGQCFLRVTVHCPASEFPLFENHLATFAAKHGLAFNHRKEVELLTEGCPDVVFKTSPEQVLALAAGFAERVIRCVALCYNGVVHAWLAPGEDIAIQVHDLARPTSQHLR